MRYVLMRKDDPITLLELSADGSIQKYSKQFINEELAPLQEKSASDWLYRWWKERSIPIKQGKVKEMLQKKGLISPEEYLVKNLGLSLTDYYWIKPIESELHWKAVNLFDNDFQDNILSFNYTEDVTPSHSYTPNSSLQGQLEKSWIIKNNKRILVKGNRDRFSSESINEVIAAKLHELQGYNNYTEYNLIRLKDKEYDFACYSEAFTNQNLELISAYGVLTSEKQTNDISTYEQLIRICTKHGIDSEKLRADLEYQIMTDFIISNRDRHLSNISILRDADTLKFLKMAPIYDSGKSLYVNEAIVLKDKDILNIQTNSFAKSELKMLSYVTDRSLVDISKLPDKKYITEMYEMDSQMDETRIRLIGEIYERKIDYFRQFQLGEDLEKIKFSFQSTPHFNEKTNKKIPFIEDL